MASIPIAEDEAKPDRKFMFGQIAQEIFDGNLDFTALDKDIPALRNAYEARPPRRLYHYSTFAGMKAIIHSQQIWCSSVLHMNDPEEFSHAFQHFKMAIEAAREHYKHDGFQSFSRKIAKQITSKYIHSDFLGFITCFTEKHDYPRQWEWYADKGDGASMEFRGMYLKVLSLHLNNHPSNQLEINKKYLYSNLVKVIYDDEVKRNIVLTTCVHLAEFITVNNITRQTKDLYRQLSYFSNAVIAILAIVPKNSGWANEHEWRIASLYFHQPSAHKSDATSSILSRPGASGPTPYVRVNLDKIIGKPMVSRITEIMFGPGGIAKAKPLADELIEQEGEHLLNTSIRYSTMIPDALDKDNTKQKKGSHP